MNSKARAAVGTALLALAAAVLSGCTPEPATDRIETRSVLLESSPASILSPDGTMTLLYGGETDPGVLLSGGFLQRTPIATVQTPARVSWAPDSRHFFINDSGGGEWSNFRLWSARGGSPVESETLRQAAIDTLARLNGCGDARTINVLTHGMGWAERGKRVLVLAEVRRSSRDCVRSEVDYVLVVADPDDGKILETHVEGEAREAYPTLEWTPVTEP